MDWWGIQKSADKSFKIDQKSLQNVKKQQQFIKHRSQMRFRRQEASRTRFLAIFLNFWMDFGGPKASPNGARMAKKRKKAIQK